MMFAYILFTC